MALLTIIQRDMEELNPFEKFEYLISLFSFYHLNRCRNGEDWSNLFGTVKGLNLRKDFLKYSKDMEFTKKVEKTIVLV